MIEGPPSLPPLISRLLWECSSNPTAGLFHQLLLPGPVPRCPHGHSLAVARRQLGCHLVRKLCVTTPTSLTVLCLLALKISVSFIIAAFYWLSRCPVSVRRELRESRGLISSAPPYFQALTQWLALVHSSTYHSGN